MMERSTNTTGKLRTIKRLRCSEVWGGIGNVDGDIAAGPVTVSLFSEAYQSESGGDIYYFSLCERDAIVRIAVADVVGHGGGVTHVSQWMYQALAERMNGIDGNGVLIAMNEHANGVGLDAMTTAAVLSYNVDGSTLDFSYAGHPPAWIRRVGKNIWQPRPLEQGSRFANVPLGLFAEATYEQERMHLYPGDRLFLHTDGLTEALSPSGEEYGEERLRAVLTAAGDASLVELKNRVLSSVRAHTGGTLGDDDVTLMAAKVN